MPVEAVVHNSPALDSLKHQQLRSLCARHGLKSTGKRDHLIKRLKALRDSSNVHEPSSEQEGLDGSFDIIDEDETEEAAVAHHSLPGSFEQASPTSTLRAAHSIAPSRTSTADEFGALSADAGTITRSSSWKDKLASVFGGASSHASISASSSSGSLSSIRTERGQELSPARAAKAAESGSNLVEQNNHHQQTFPHPSSSGNAIASTSASILTSNTQLQVPPTPSGPTSSSSYSTAANFRILEDSFIQANSTYPDCSFVPRSSFEGNSVDLANVPVWPPPPGVILISPRQSPAKPASVTMHAGMSGAHFNGVMASAQKKRYLDDVNEDDDEHEHGDDNGNRYGSIRLIPKMAQLESANTPGRKIAQLPKRMSMIASSPPRFDLDAPPLPSFATVANQALQRDIVNALQGGDVPTSDNNEEGASRNTITMQDDNVRASSETLEQDAPLHRIQQQQQQQQQRQAEQQQPFVFGSPRQQPVTDDTFLKRIDGFAIAKQLEELQRRTGTTGIAMGNGTVRKDWMPRTASSGNLQANKGGNVRFEDKHQKEFKMMDSIANHYAARRKVSGNQSPHKRTRTESADAVSTLSRTSGNTAAANTGASSSVHRQASCPALSLSSSASFMGINQQGRYAPIIPPRPKQAKTSAQQAEDRERIQRLQHGSSSSSANAAQRRAGRASVSPRKALNNPSTRKLPPLPSTSSASSSLSSNSTGTASKLFKSTISSLKSFGSSSSLSSKAGGGSVAHSTSTRNLEQAQAHLSDFGTLSASRPTVANNSITRPTLASLARQTSRNNLDIIASPPSVSVSSKPSSLSIKQHAPSPRSTPTDKNNLLSPRSNAGTQGVEKKKVSSISVAHRNSPIKPGLDDSIAQARRIRAKKLGAQMQQSTAPAPSSNAPQVVRSPSKSMALSASGCVSSRPAWR